MPALWEEWENWFVELEESHTSFPALIFFRSPSGDRSWITAAGAALDTASVYMSAIDLERTPRAALMIRSGFQALRAIADFFDIAYDPDPSPTDPISVHRSEFDAVYETLLEAGLPLQTDRKQAWVDFAGWRVNYDTILVELCSLTMAPYSPWASDRSAAYRLPHLFRRRPLKS